MARRQKGEKYKTGKVLKDTKVYVYGPPSTLKMGMAASSIRSGEIIYDVEIVHTATGISANGWSPTEPVVVISFKCPLSSVDPHAPSSSTENVRRYAILSTQERGIMGPECVELGEFSEEESSTTSYSGGGNTKADDPANNENNTDDYTPRKNEDAYWTENEELWTNGIYADQKAVELSTYLNKLGGSAKVSMRLFGLPYQFMPSVDSRLPSVSTTMGVQYLRNIISESAILTITPGQAKYMGDMSADSKTKTMALIENMNVFDNISSNKLTVDNHDGYKYYDFEQQYTEYMKYVNMLCRTTAAFMKLESMPVDTDIQTRLGEFDWKDYRFNGVGYNTLGGDLMTWTGEQIKDFTSSLKDKATEFGADAVNLAGSLSSCLSSGKSITESLAESWNSSFGKGEYNKDYPNSAKSVGEGKIVLEDSKSGEQQFLDWMRDGFISTNESFVQFVINPSSFNETSSNLANDSQLKGGVDQLAGTMRELEFISGSVGLSEGQLSEFAQDSTEALLGALSELGGNGLGTMVGRISTGVKHTITGSRIIFPKVYQESNYNKSYSVSIELKSPYGDRYSYYMNVLVPLMHLLALTAPRQTSANTYDSPFIVRASLPGMWQCNMGLVTSLDISRSGTDGISVDGYPLALKIDMQIEDLYADLMITSSEDPTLFMCNTGLVDFIMVQCGLDVTRKNYEERMNAQVTGLIDFWKDIGSNCADAFNAYISSNVGSFLNNFFAG